MEANINSINQPQEVIAIQCSQDGLMLQTAEWPMNVRSRKHGYEATSAGSLRNVQVIDHVTFIADAVSRWIRPCT
jgi:non-homologous end joining protein Ku